MIKAIFQLILFLCIGYLALCVLMYALQRQLLYFPTSASNNAVQTVLDIPFDSQNIKVVATNTQYEKAVIYFGGNAENVYVSAVDMQPALTGFANYLVNYQGYGGSDGKPSEGLIYQTARQVYAHVKERHSTISLVGRSLGTGVAMELASQHAVDKVVLVTPYDSIANIAATHYPFLTVRWLIKDKFDSLSKSEKVNADVIMLVAGRDTIIPNKHSEKLHSALINRNLPSSADYRVFEFYDHNTIQQHPRFMELVYEFLVK